MVYVPNSRVKPVWLQTYQYYVWGGLFLSIVFIFTFIEDSAPQEWPGMIARFFVYCFATYSLQNWDTARSKHENVVLQAAIVILNLVYMSPLAGTMPIPVDVLYSAVTIPVYIVLPYYSALFLTAIAAYFSFCWLKFTPGTEDSVAPHQSVVDPLGDEPGSIGSVRKQATQRKPEEQKSEDSGNLASGCGFVIIGIPVLVGIVMLAIVMTTASGEGFGTFLVLVVVLIATVISKLK